MFTYDLVDLRLFSAAARAGSVSQAASEVHLAVSSASARLKAFEARSGVKLFERRPHGVDLTPAGVETVHAVRAMLHDAEVLESVLTRFRMNHQEVCVAALPNAMTVGLADDVSAFLEQNPEVSIKLTNYARAGRLLDSVLNRTCDLAFTSWTGGHAELLCAPYRPLRLAAVFAPESSAGKPLRGQKGVRLADLFDFDFIALDRDTALRHVIDEEVAKTGGRLRVKIWTESYASALHFAAAGRGVTILPLEAAKKDERVCALTLDEPWASLLIRIWHVPNLKELNPDADALLRFLVNASAPSRAGMKTL